MMMAQLGLKHVAEWILHKGHRCVRRKTIVLCLRYPACNVHAPYYHLWPALLYCIFRLYLINGTISEKKVTKHKMWFW